MPNALFPNIASSEIEYVGFDMDGTLYDEYDFITEVYDDIFIRNGEDFISQKEVACETALNRWLEKGSSYHYIFDEIFEQFGCDPKKKEAFIKRALSIFRNFHPQHIGLNKRVRHILDYCKKNYFLFLVSDGNPILQQKKFDTLGLGEYFDSEYVFFTGLYSLNKNNTEIINYIPARIIPEKTVFFGDRRQDKEFAQNFGCEFIQVHNMLPLKEHMI